ncbi:MAG: cadmium-translocating P-type ATPase [Clostridiales bacterium]|nr:cadmium-translocating P-type ATPase [Clostridiales bacterium]
MIKKYKIEGLDCANCARELEEELNKIEGVTNATVDFIGGKVILDCAENAVAPALYCCNHFEDAKIVGEVGAENPGADGDKKLAADCKKIKIKNLCCANCGRELEEELNKIEGVSATVDFMNMTVLLKTGTRESYDKAVYCITHFEDVKIVEDGEKKKSVFKENLVDIIAVIISAVFFIPAVVLDFLKLGGAVTYVIYALYGVAFAAAGYIVLWNTVRNILKGRVFDENFLMTIASVGAVVLGITTGDGLFEGVAVMLLYRIGELLQSVAVGSSRRSITRLMDLKSDTATLIKGDEQIIVAPESLASGDRILIKAGEKVPVDCRILAGETALDMKSLNGEAMPREVKAGDEILSGAINISGVIEAEVVREYKNSAVSKILELVENSTAKKAKPEKFITKFAKYYTPAVVVAALIVAGIVPTVICAVAGAYTWAVYSDWIYKALSFLVISCPCALVISVPLAYFGGIGRSAKDGILVKGSTCIDELAKATVAAFDKTGTLTEGVFAVKSYSSEEALKLAACAEKFSSHPIAAAFKDVETAYVCEGAKEVAGRGVTCTVDGKTLLCGNAQLLSENGVESATKESASTLVYVALDGAYVGVIEIDDRIKAGAKEAIAELKKGGVAGAYMLTGDNAARADGVAKELGLDGVFAGLLPDEKLEKAKELKERGGLIYAGDGINDAPVMTVANCAVSMGRVGSDAAIEASDIVLVSDNLKALPKARKIAKGTRWIVVENIVGSLVVKFAIMALSIAIPSFPLIISIFADVGVMLVAVCNSLRTALIK